MASQQPRLMMFPWLAFGHMIPFVELSKKLAKEGILISYVSTPKNLLRLPPIPSHLEDRINFVEVSLPKVDGLPENCEATVDVQTDQTQFLKKAYDGLAQQFEDLIKQDAPDLIMIDFAAHWIPEIAAEFGVPVVFFSVYTAATLAFLGPPEELKLGRRRPSAEHFTRSPDWIPFPSLLGLRPEYAARMAKNCHTPDASGLSSGQRMTKIVENCSFVALRSCEEFEGRYIRLIRDLYQKPVFPVGLLPPSLEENKRDDSWFSDFKWLDGQKPKSVVFVGFGSEYKMPIEQVHELAYALELSRLPFLWILRKPQGIRDSDLLPCEFSNRTSKQGIVILGWAPQLEILAHSAIGGCLFHSGWGTIIESLGFGHPLILLPMVADQGINAKLLVENEMGYEVPVNEDGSFSREMVAKSVRMVLVDPEGEKIRSQAAQMKRVFRNEQSEECYLSSFIKQLKLCTGLKGKNQD